MTPRPLSEVRFILLLGALVAFGPLAVDLYLPALPSIADNLQTTPEAIQISITVFLAGFAVGMLFYGPLSDRYGRRNIMLGGIVLFVIAGLACMLAPSAEHLIAARFLQAIGGGAASVLARAVVRDVYVQTDAIRILSLMAMVTAIAPLLAPLIGSGLLLFFGWRGVFAAIVLWGLLCLIAVWRFLPETLSEKKKGPLSLTLAFLSYGRLSLDPIVIGLILAGGMSFAAMFAYITASPFYFITLHHFSPSMYGVIFAVNALGILIVSYLNSRLAKTQGPVVMAMIGSIASFIGALLLTVAMIVNDSVVVVIVGLFVIVSMTGLLGANCVGILMMRYPQNAGAVAALFGSGQFGFGMCASAVVSYFHDGSGHPMSIVILASTAISLSGYLLFHYRLHSTNINKNIP